MKNYLIMGMVLLMVVSGCQKNIDVEVETNILLETDRAFAKKSEEVGAAEAFRQFLSEDAFMLPNGGNPIYGRDTIFARMSDDDDYLLKWVPEKAEVSSAGDFGYTWGNYTYSRLNDEGDSLNSAGKYLNIWKKDENNRWKVQIDMGNTNPS